MLVVVEIWFCSEEIRTTEVLSLSVVLKFCQFVIPNQILCRELAHVVLFNYMDLPGADTRIGASSLMDDDIYFEKRRKKNLVPIQNN